MNHPLLFGFHFLGGCRPRKSVVWASVPRSNEMAISSRVCCWDHWQSSLEPNDSSWAGSLAHFLLIALSSWNELNFLAQGDSSLAVLGGRAHLDQDGTEVRPVLLSPFYTCWKGGPGPPVLPLHNIFPKCWADPITTSPRTTEHWAPQACHCWPWLKSTYLTQLHSIIMNIIINHQDNLMELLKGELTSYYKNKRKRESERKIDTDGRY